MFNKVLNIPLICIYIYIYIYIYIPEKNFLVYFTFCFERIKIPNDVQIIEELVVILSLHCLVDVMSEKEVLKKENRRFFDIFRGYRSGTLVENWLIKQYHFIKIFQFHKDISKHYST